MSKFTLLSFFLLALVVVSFINTADGDASPQYGSYNFFPSVVGGAQPSIPSIQYADTIMPMSFSTYQ